MSLGIHLNGPGGTYAAPFFSVNYCGVFVPVVIIIETPQLRKFAKAYIKDTFNSFISCVFN